MRAALPLVLGAIVCGALVRIYAGMPLLHSDLATGGGPSPVTPAGGAELTVLAFYENLGKGDYAKAWALSLEPAWAAGRSVSYGNEQLQSSSVPGWTSEADFVSRCKDDIGEGMRLNEIRVERLATLPRGQSAPLAVLKADRLIGVKASGRMLGACLIYRWDRDLVVAEVGGKYRVVLPGTKPAKSFFHQSWFSNLSLVGSLRAGGG